MPKSTKRQPKRWVYSPRKPAPPKIAPLLKAEITGQGQALVETYFKPTYVRSPPENPDHNPIEGLWKWLREDATQNYCHQTLAELRHDCQAFIDDLNLEPEQIITRRWPRFELDPEVEKLRVSS
jgi:transposase